MPLLPKRILRRSIVGLAILSAVAIALPYIAAVQPFRDWMLRAVVPVREGTVSSGGASLGWFSPVCFYDIQIRSSDGETVVSIPALRGDRPLVYYLSSEANLGTFRVERPQLNVVETAARQFNIQRVFSKGSAPPDVSVAVEIVDAGLAFQSAHAAEPWHVERFNLSVALQSSRSTEDGRPEVVVSPGKVFDRTPVTPQMCDDMLKYIAPILAEAANISGAFSIDLDEWRWPAGKPDAARGSGRLTIHAIDVGPGPLVRGIADLLGLPPSVRLADNSVVQFRMADGRVEHRDLEFGIGQARVRTHGSVGLDESLDLVAEVPIPSALLGDSRLGRLLQGKTVKIPIGGTLKQPKIDAKALGRDNLKEFLGDSNLLGSAIEDPSASAILDAVGEFLKNRPPPGERLLDRLRQPTEPRERPLLDRLRNRRRTGGAGPS